MLYKKELISAIAADSKLDKKAITEVMNSLVRITHREVSAGRGVSLLGIGKIYAKDMPERKIRNPKTGETVMRKPGKVARIQISAKLRRSLPKE